MYNSVVDFNPLPQTKLSPHVSLLGFTLHS